MGLHVAVYVLASQGHIDAASGLSNALIDRGHRITVFTTADCIRQPAIRLDKRECIKSTKDLWFDLVPRAEAKVLPSINIEPEYMDVLALPQNLGLLFRLLQSGAANCARLSEELHKADPFHVVIADITTPCGLLAAELLKLPLIVNNPLPVYVASRDILSLSLPAMWLGKGRSQRSLLSLRARLLNVFEHFQEMFVTLIERQALNEVRAELGLPLAGIWGMLTASYSPTIRDAWYLQNTFWGLEVPRALSPRIFFVGTSFDVDETLAAVRNRRGAGGSSGSSTTSESGKWLSWSTRTAVTSASADVASGASVSDDVLAWLDDEKRREVVYVSLGTLSRPQPEQYALIVDALSQLPLDVLFSVREDMQGRLPPSLTELVASGTAAVFPTVPQLLVLAHPRVAVFLSHCGANSMVESLALGTPIVGFPMMFDQLSLCDQARAVGAAVCSPIHEATFTAEVLRSAFSRVVFDERESFAAAVGRQSKLLRFAGGPKRGADIVELLAYVGPEALRDPLPELPLALRLHLDLIAIALVAVLVPCWMLWRACRALLGRKRASAREPLSAAAIAKGAVAKGSARARAKAD